MEKGESIPVQKHFRRIGEAQFIPYLFPLLQVLNRLSRILEAGETAQNKTGNF